MQSAGLCLCAQCILQRSCIHYYYSRRNTEERSTHRKLSSEYPIILFPLLPLSELVDSILGFRKERLSLSLSSFNGSRVTAIPRSGFTAYHLRFIGDVIRLQNRPDSDQ